MKIKILRKNILSILKLFHSYLLRHVSAVTICSPSKGQSPYLGSRSYSLLFVEGHHPSSFSLSYLHQQFSPLMDLSLQIFCLKSPLGMQCTPANTSFLSFLSRQSPWKHLQPLTSLLDLGELVFCPPPLQGNDYSCQSH